MRLTNSRPHALHTVGEKETTEKPSVRVVNPCRKARTVEPTPTCTAMTATSRKHQNLRLLREYHLLSQWTVAFMRKSDGRSMYADFTDVSFVMNSHQRPTASFAPRDVLLCSLVAPMSGSSSSDWWDGWAWRGDWANSPSPDEEEIPQNREGTRHVGFQRQRCIRSHGGRCYGARMAGRGQACLRPEVCGGRGSRGDLPQCNQAHTRKDRSARETRQDRDDEGGLIGVQRSGLLPNTHRAPGRDIRDLNTLNGQLCQSRTTQW